MPSASEGKATAPAAPPQASAQQLTPQQSISEPDSENTSPTMSIDTETATTGGTPRMAVQDEGVTYSEAQIAVHWREEEYYSPPPKFIGQANASDPGIRDRFREENYPECFKEYADLLSWDQYWHTTLDTSNPPFWKWFVGGRLNASFNCVDRHLQEDRNKPALLWVPEPENEATQAVTYQDLYVRVNEFAALLRDFGGVTTGDRVTFHLPMVPELPVSMLACARLGVIHSEVFGGFSGVACGGRIADSGSHILVTMDGYYRNGAIVDHKAKADEAVAAAAQEGVIVDKVLVWRRYPGRYVSQTPMVPGRDFFVDDLLAQYRGQLVEPVSMPAEAPLFLMYTSGTTGKPKGCQHSTGGYLAYVTGTSKYYQDIHPSDTYWCFADIGWITGHSYIVYGPLSLGTTSVMYEGVPLYPDAGRPWRIAEQLGVTIFHTAPTTIRMLRKAGPDEPSKYTTHFKHMTTVGEPIEPEVWRWYYNSVGKGKAVIVDTWWQTENGGFLCSTLPGLENMKPGSCGPGVLGVYPSSTMKWARRCQREAAGPATSVSATPGRASSRPSGANRSALSRPTTPSTARIVRARIGTTGPTLPEMARCWPLTATSGFWVASMTSSTWPGTGWVPKRSNRPVSRYPRWPRRRLSH